MTTRNALLFSGGRFQPQARPSPEPVLDSSSEQTASQPASCEPRVISAVSSTQHPALWPRQQTQLGCRYSTPPAQYKERYVVRCSRIFRAA